MAKALDKSVYNQIVTRLRRGDTRSQVMKDLTLNAATVGKCAVHSGIAKAKPEVKKRDSELVESWLAASKTAERRPAARTAKPKAKKRPTKKAAQPALKVAAKPATRAS